MNLAHNTYSAAITEFLILVQGTSLLDEQNMAKTLKNILRNVNRLNKLNTRTCLLKKASSDISKFTKLIIVDKIRHAAVQIKKIAG